MANNYFSTLNANHHLFVHLQNDNPTWWLFIKKNIGQDGFYVDVRKDNSLNVYYNGGSLLKIVMQKKELKCTIHEKYLNPDATGSKYVYYNPNNLPQDAKLIKDRIKMYYGDSSESGIKARLINAPGATYIDSEFAYPEANGTKIGKDGTSKTKYDTTRIDLVKIENGKIVFVELKRIEDGRLLDNKYEAGHPEVLDQMEVYHSFVKRHRAEIEGYYRKLFRIKKTLGILPQSLSALENIDDCTLNENVELYVDPYDKLHTDKRKRRVDAIKTILIQNNIVHNL